MTGSSHDFPRAGLAEWRAQATRELKDSFSQERLTHVDLDGLSVPPLYPTDVIHPSSAPGRAPFARGARSVESNPSPWRIATLIDAPNLQEAKLQIASDVAYGATALVLRVGPGALPFTDVDHFAALLAEVDLERIAIHLDAGARFEPAAHALLGVWNQRGVASPRGSLGADPVGAAVRGDPPVSIEETMTAASALAARFPGVPAFEVSTVPYHDAGATPAQTLAIALAGGVAALRALVARGIDVSLAASSVRFVFALDCEVFQSIALLRAARITWAEVTRACGVSEDRRGMEQHAYTSSRVLTRRDPWVNILRGTTGAFAAIVGGANTITVAPFDAAIGRSDAFARRLARNTQLVLAHESHLGHVIDPAGGSAFVEDHTWSLAEAAWSIFREIEGRGGLLGALETGWLPERIAWAADARQIGVRRRKIPITGVSEFPSLAEAPVSRPRGTELPRRRSAEGVPVLMPRRIAEPFESLRDASDAHLAAHGARPQIFAASLGPIAEHNPRTMFAQNLFEAGGVMTLVSDGYTTVDATIEAFTSSGAEAAVICSSDAMYAEHAAPLADRLKKSGATWVALAGRPGQREAELRQAGVNAFVFLGCDVIAALMEAHRALGVES